MKRNAKRKTNKWFAVVLLVFMITVFFSYDLLRAQEPRWSWEGEKRLHFVVTGMFYQQMQMGSDSDYLPGENDFPVTPSFTGFGLGLGFLMDISKKFALQVSADYVFGGEVQKIDPSDSEFFLYKTYNTANFLASGVLKLNSRKIQSFLTAGGGLSMLLPYDDSEDTGSTGSIVLVEAPDKKTYPMLMLGGGVMIRLKSAGFLKIELQFTRVLDYDKNAIFLKLGYAF